MRYTFTEIFESGITKWVETDMQPSDFAEVSVLGELGNGETLFLGVFSGGAKRILKGFSNLVENAPKNSDFVFPEKLTSETAISILQEINATKWHECFSLVHAGCYNTKVSNDYIFALTVSCFIGYKCEQFSFENHFPHNENIERFNDLKQALISGIISD